MRGKRAWRVPMTAGVARPWPRLPRPGRAATPRSATQIVAWMRANWALLAVYVAFALAAVVVPTLAPVATTDDWAYARSAQILLARGTADDLPRRGRHGRLPDRLGSPLRVHLRADPRRLPALDGRHHGAGRTGALWALPGPRRRASLRSALGVATFLFNPLVFVLAFTFMTDAHFMALLVIATWLYARALAPDGDRWPAARRRVGRGGAGLPHPAARGVDRPGGRAVSAPLAAVALRPGQPPASGPALSPCRCWRPAATTSGFAYGNDVRQVQSTFFREMLEEGWSGTWWLLRRLTVVELMYLGLFTLPLMAAAATRRARRSYGHRSSWLDPVCGLASDPPRRRHGALGARRAHALHRAVLRLGRAGRSGCPRLAADPARSRDPLGADRRLLSSPRSCWH